MCGRRGAHGMCLPLGMSKNTLSTDDARDQHGNPSGILEQANDVFDETMDRSAALYDAMVPDFPMQAQYAVAMAYRVRYAMQFNAREAIHMLELRSSPQGHPSYRRVALEMHRLIAEQAGHTAIANAMTHLTTEAPELERLAAERRAEARRSST